MKIPATRSVYTGLGCSALALAAAACATDTTATSEEFVINGRVHAPAGYDLTGLWATWRFESAARVDSSRIGSAGTFEIHASGTDADETGELSIAGSGELHPFLFPFHVDSVPDPDVVLVPRTWTVQNGIHQGEVVTTSLDSAVDDNADQYRYSYFFGQPYPFNDPELYLLDLMTWPTARFPAHVAFDHANGDPAFTAQDSADIWDVLDRMEEVFGIDLFQPIEAEAAWWPDPPEDDPGLVPGVIRVIFTPPTWRGLPLSDEEPAEWERDLGQWAAGGRFTAFRVKRSLLGGGALWIGALEPLQLADGLIPWETVLMHEMLHVLGVGHTCRIPSPMGPCLRTDEPSAYDVAYMELLREIVSLEREQQTFFGIMPAVIGERKLLLGRQALPSVDQ
jgi:hypothetical protein